MNYEKIINDFVKDGAGEFIVTDRHGKVLYRNRVEDFTDEQWMGWAAFNIDAETIDHEEEWEISDRNGGNYYNAKSLPVKDDGEEVILHHVYNTSQYATLLRDVSGYLKDWRDLSAFQTAMLEKLSGNYESCLPVVLKYFKVSSAVMYIGRERKMERHLLSKGTKTIASTRIDREDVFDTAKGEFRKLPGLGEDEYLCYISDSAIHGTDYALYLYSEELENDDDFSMHYNVIKLFIENGLLREQITYESEHDKLTSLYNKGKYMSMISDFLPKKNRVAIYNMDVNYLKRTNDTLGHEAGDALLVKAGKSLLAVEKDNVRGFRMGGDEFMLLGWDLEEDEAVAIKKEWEEALDKLNKNDSGAECIIACGLAYGKDDFDLKELLKKADDLMYENKVAIKLSRGEDPNAR